MLLSMTVQNIALIEHMHITFDKGMHVLSGETGAGKSILVDSINLVLGGRADRGLIRAGCQKASVEALMDVRGQEKVLALLAEQELTAEGDVLTIMREITTGERNICRVCGVIVPLAYLRKVTSLLVDIHGQHEHESLLDSKHHMGFLDAFGDQAFEALKAEVKLAYQTWRESSSAYASIRKENAQREQRQLYLQTQVKDLEDAQLVIGESETLTMARDRFSSAEKIDTSLKNAYHLLALGGKNDSITQQLQSAMQSMQHISDLDERFLVMATKLTTAYYEAQEMGIELRDLLEDQHFDQEQNEMILQRLDLIRRLERRYGMEADALVHHYEEMKDELGRLEHITDRLQRAEKDYKKKLQQYRLLAGKLTMSRQALAKMFEGIMEAQLADLGMKETRFACVFEQTPPTQKKVPTANGDDLIAFYIAPNVGEPLKPLDKTASGGELSRLMLAMKSAGAMHDDIPCMIFDEIDTGISGHIAGVVAEKMASIARYHQVLCVTHLAQIAAMADHQYLVKKSVENDRTFTTITPLSRTERISEVARLIGVTDEKQQSGILHAQTMMQLADDTKQKWQET